MNDYLSVRGVPPKLKRDFKVAAARRGESIRAAIVRLMQAYVEEVSRDRSD
jgi:plasmid stability protein